MNRVIAPESEHLASGYITVDEDWRITACNQKATLILKQSAEKIIGYHCREIFEADERFKKVCAHLAPLSKKRGSQSIELTLGNPKTGANNAIRFRIITLPGKSGAAIGAIIGFADLSEPLAASRLAINSIIEGVFTVDPQWQITSFNTAAENITGYREEEVLGRSCKEIFKADICNSNCALSDCFLKRQTITGVSGHIESKAGKKIPVRINASPLFDMYENLVGGVETFIDITTDIHYEAILAAVADGVLTVDPEGRITSFNNAAEKITGFQAEEIKGQLYTEIFYVGDDPAQCPLNKCLTQKISIIDNERFVIGKDGHAIPVTVSAAPILARKGNVLGAVQSFRDNTRRLQQLLILDSVADGVFTVDRDWQITSFNLSAELITGWSKEEALGKYCSDIFRSSICGVDCALAESLYIGKPVANRSIVIKNRVGKEVSISISAAPLIDHAGNVIGGVETFRDLSVEQSLRQQLSGTYRFEQIISKSPNMQRMFQILPDIARSGSNVLILGESGTGKELIANAIFNGSPRKDEPFIVVNCGALPDTLLESELFGYKAGAFTDARRDKIGRFAAAEGGTLFLDEIGDIPQSLQVKLLRVLQHKVYEPLGSNTPVQADVRIIAATNRDLPELARTGAFRDDLYYRLSVVNILLPPLRERREDIPLLVDHFVDKFRAEKRKDIAGVNDDVMGLLMRYDYPGNIRELENIIEYGFILCPGGLICPEHLPDWFEQQGKNGPGTAPLLTDATCTLEEIEKNAIFLALQRNRWKKLKTCRELGISKDTLRRKIKRYDLEDSPPPSLSLASGSR